MQPQTIARHQISTPAAGLRAAFLDDKLVVVDRPLAEAEWNMVRAFARRLGREDVRLRFGCPLDLRDAATLRQVFDIRSGNGEIVWALDEGGAIAGLAHRIRLSQAEAEIALIVRSDLKRRGIGEFLLRGVLARAVRQGLKTLSALVLWENRPMLQLAAKIGYVAGRPAAGTVELTFVLEQTTARPAEYL